jgi:hypothetical protein
VWRRDGENTISQVEKWKENESFDQGCKERRENEPMNKRMKEEKEKTRGQKREERMIYSTRE